MILEIWVLGSATAIACYCYEAKLYDKKATGDGLWACIIFSWVVVAGYAGESLAKLRLKRLASVDRSPEGQDAQRLDAKHESAVGSEASETPHTSRNTPKETSHD
jgi:hypothetical protein